MIDSDPLLFIAKLTWLKLHKLDIVKDTDDYNEKQHGKALVPSDGVLAPGHREIWLQTYFLQRGSPRNSVCASLCDV
ncbi:MAG: hypothetical protein ACLVDB_09260 [Anaeromassilibacillus sp.]